MDKFKFIGEYAFRASKKMLFPYISTASGLSQWFAENVNINEDKSFTFIWDGDMHKAKLTSSRVNHHVRFEFIDDEDEDPNYLEIRIDQNDLTEEVFMRVTDYSDLYADEAQELWDGLIHDLKEIVGG